MVKPLVIVGMGGFGREVADVVEAIDEAASRPEWRLMGMVDDGPSDLNQERLQSRGIAYLGTVDAFLTQVGRPHYVVGVGNPRVRRQIAERLDEAGLAAATLIHPDASVGSQTTLGEGAVVLAGARLTTNISVGRHVHVNPNVTVGHDTVIEDFVSLNPACSISGDCVIETGSLIGVGAVVLNQLRVGAESVVGGSACVVRDVPRAAVVKGVPAR